VRLLHIQEGKNHRKKRKVGEDFQIIKRNMDLNTVKGVGDKEKKPPGGSPAQKVGLTRRMAKG